MTAPDTGSDRLVCVCRLLNASGVGMVADLDTLIRSKQTGRLQDQADVESLEHLKQLRQSSADT